MTVLAARFRHPGRKHNLSRVVVSAKTPRARRNLRLTDHEAERLGPALAAAVGTVRRMRRNEDA